MLWINLIIKHCVSCWITYILQDDIRSIEYQVNPLNAELNPIRHLIALAGVHHFVHVSRIRFNKIFVYILYLKLLIQIQEWVPHTWTIKQKCSYQYISANSYRGITQHLVGLKPLDFYVEEHLKLPEYSAPIENEESLHQRIFTPVKPLLTAREPSKQCKSTSSDMFMRVLIQVDNIWNICFTQWLYKQQ
jgi:hypothetical protein